MDNANFERDQKIFFKKVEGGTEHVGQITEIIFERHMGKR